MREWATFRKLDFPARDHLELAGELIDIERAARLSGSRFAYLKGDLVMLELALVRWALEKLARHGFEPVIPPVLVRERALYGTGFLPDTEQQIYSLAEDELYLVGTSEVALASLHDGEILDARASCRCATRASRRAFAARRAPRARTRAASSACTSSTRSRCSASSRPRTRPPSTSGSSRSRRRSCGELGLPYRVVNIAVGDLGSSAAKKYDCEAWLPSQGRYRELTSCSNTTDYQARRLNIRMRGSDRAARDAHAAHAQRHRGGGRAHDRGAAGERPAGRRQRGIARVPDALRRPRAAAPSARRTGSPARLDIKKIGSAASIKLVWDGGAVAQAQRIRILRAMADAMAERGAAGATVSVADVIARAGVSRAVFRELFADREACLLAAFELAVALVETRMGGAYEAEPRWLDGIRAALASLLGFVEEEPALAALCVVYSMSGGADVLRRRAEVLGQLTAVVDRGRLQVPPGRPQPPPVIAEGVVGAVLAIVQNRLLLPERPPMADLFGPLMSMIVMPYMGPAVARRELTRPAPRTADSAGASPHAAGHGGGTDQAPAGRLTYRTARVLTAIGDYPGASNREVGERAGVVDQGQISKLLTRLQAQGLIAKTGAAQARGAPNSWQLTARGQAVVAGDGVRAKAGAARP